MHSTPTSLVQSVSCTAMRTPPRSNTHQHTHMNVYLTLCCRPPSRLLVASLVAQRMLLVVVGFVPLAVAVAVLSVAVAVVAVSGPLFLFRFLSSFPLAVAAVVVVQSSF